MKGKFLAIMLLLAGSGCISTGFSAPAVPPPRATLAGGEPRAHVSVREDRGEIEIVAGPFHVPAAADPAEHHPHHEDDHLKSPLVVVPWPVDAGLAGMRMAIYREDGTPLPRKLVHHLIGVNFERRQLVYLAAERIFGFGTETPDVKLPDFLEVPMEPGDSLGIYAMWNNTTGSDLQGVYLQVLLPYTTGRREREKAFPIYLDTNNQVGGKTSFDLPPGWSEHAYEFELPVGGGLLAASGHLHDYGVELRLEEVATGRILTRMEPEIDDEGRVTAVEQKIYRRLFGLIDGRLRLERGVRYRVVGVYENPTGEFLVDGGMAHIVGLFVPEDASLWPAVNPRDPLYQADVAGLPAPLEGVHVHR